MSDAEQRRKLEELARKYAWDVAGNFDPRVYKFAAKAAAPLIGVLLSPRTTLRGLHHSFDLTSLDGRIDVQGPREHVRKLSRLGTVIHVPTHLSNLDSVVFGFALERSGLPPATYGAGKNLFTNPILSFFMHNLGAYRGPTGASNTGSTKTSSRRTRAFSSSGGTTRSSSPAGPARAVAGSSGS